MSARGGLPGHNRKQSVKLQPKCRCGAAAWRWFLRCGYICEACYDQQQAVKATEKGPDMPTPVGAMFTDARVFVSCPRCHAVAGDVCRMPSGRKSRTPHDERVIKYRREYPEQVKLCYRNSERPAFLQKQAQRNQ